MTTDVNAVDVVGLGATLDDIEDLPSFTTLPTGAFHVKLNEGIVRKDIAKEGEPPRIMAEVVMTLVSVIEMAPDALDEGEVAPKEGDIATMGYMLGNKFGVGRYKEDWLVHLSAALGTKVIGEIESGSKGLELGVVIKRVNGKKENADKKYMRIQTIQVM